MKKIFLSWMLLITSLVVFGQGNSGLGFNYQAVVRGDDGAVIPSRNVELRFSLFPGPSASEASWVETHNVMTDAYGIIGVTIGKGQRYGGVATAFSDVNFAAVHYWLKIDIKESGIYRELSYAALASVPYAEATPNAAMPVGMVMVFAGDVANIPNGWLLCDGQEVSRSEYAALYKIIGSIWGNGNNSSTFNLPDMRGVFLRGVSGTSNNDTNADSRTSLKLGGNSGNKVGSYQNDEIKSHKHGLTAAITVAVGGSTTSPGGFQPADGFSSNNRPNAISETGGSETRPKNVYVHYIIKY